MLKKPNNPGLKKLPAKVRNNMGYAATGGNVKTKLKEITGALKKLLRCMQLKLKL